MGRKPPLEGTDDAARHRLIQPEGIADRKRGLPDLQVGRAAESHLRWKLAHAADPQDRKIVIGGGADQINPSHLSRRKADRDLAAIGHDMVVRDEMPVAVPDKSRAGSAALPLLSHDWSSGRSHRNLDNRGRHSFEDVDGGPFGLGQRTTLLDGARGGGCPWRMLDLHGSYHE